jgi:hypothetical protein
MRRRDPERLHLAGRAARLARLRHTGLTEEAAEAAMVAWEVRADAEGRQRGTSAFWDGLEAWAAFAIGAVVGAIGLIP